MFEWDVVEQMYIPFGGYNQYTVIRNEDGTYSVANGSSYATGSSANRTLYYTQRNEGKFIIVETRAPEGYYGDWTTFPSPVLLDRWRASAPMRSPFPRTITAR